MRKSELLLIIVVMVMLFKLLIIEYTQNKRISALENVTFMHTGNDTPHAVTHNTRRLNAEKS